MKPSEIIKARASEIFSKQHRMRMGNPRDNFWAMEEGKMFAHINAILEYLDSKHSQ